MHFLCLELEIVKDTLEITSIPIVEIGFSADLIDKLQLPIGGPLLGAYAKLSFISRLIDASWVLGKTPMRVVNTMGVS